MELSKLTEEELILLRSTLCLEMYKVDREIVNRKFEAYRRSKPKVNLTEADLAKDKVLRGKKKSYTKRRN